MTDLLTPLDRRQALDRRARAPRGDVHDPATGEVQRAGRRRRARPRSTRPCAAAKAAFREWRDTSLTKRRPGAVRVPRAAQPAQRDELAAVDHLRARQGRSRRARRGERAGSRSSSSPAACPHLLKGGFSENVSGGVDSTRSASRSAWSPASRRSTSRRWCRCGCSRSRSRAATPSCSSRREKDPSAADAASPSCWQRGRAARRRVQRRARRQGGGRRAARPPRRRGGQLRRLHADRAATSTRPAPRTASACRRSAAPRTTWSCCPTPTSTWPPTPRSSAGVRLGRRALHGDLGAWSRSTRSATSWSAKIDERIAELTRRRRAPSAARDGPAGHRGSTATRSRRYLDAGVAAGRRRWSSTAATSSRPARAAAASGSGRPLFDHVTPEMTVYTRRDLRPGAVASCARRRTTRRWRWSTPTRTATASRSSPTTAARRAGSSTRSRSAWSASTSRSRCRWRTTRSAAGRPRCSATPTCTASRACTSSRAARSSPAAGPTRATRGVNLGFPQNG